ncbi:hypothetical protein FKM82_007142 [Ascaphus truei]
MYVTFLFFKRSTMNSHHCMTAFGKKATKNHYTSKALISRNIHLDRLFYSSTEKGNPRFHQEQTCIPLVLTHFIKQVSIYIFELALYFTQNVVDVQ